MSTKEAGESSTQNSAWGHLGCFSTSGIFVSPASEVASSRHLSLLFATGSLFAVASCIRFRGIPIVTLHSAHHSHNRGRDFRHEGSSIQRTGWKPRTVMSRSRKISGPEVELFICFFGFCSPPSDATSPLDVLPSEIRFYFWPYEGKLMVNALLIRP